MDKPNIAGKSPHVTEADIGNYFWCACGRSSTQPYCDGSHKGTGFSPVEVKIGEGKTVAYCMCKQTSTPPFCDGSHKHL